MPKPSSSEESSPSSTSRVKVNAKKKFSLGAVISALFASLKLITRKKTIVNANAAPIHLDPYKINGAINEQEILNNFLTFSNKTVEDAMIPRSDIVAVKHDINLTELFELIIKTHHTRTLVYEGTLDNIIGFVHIKDLFMILAQNKNFQLKKIIRKPIISAPSMKLTDLLITMQRQRTHISIIVDEYGGTDGIVTIEDIMEEIVGRIDDEHDDKLESDAYQILDSSTVLSSSRVEVEDLERILGVKLKDDKDEFDTIGGLVLAKVGNVPSPGTKIEISNQVELEVIDANARTLKQVKLTLKNAQHIPTKSTS
ncbi:Hemolysin C [Candidatus Trichorickettsia mobilis]|uniref:Hemolysin C n=1 Tax=Candidatus Trichorickettsia mobilis TaxID=1346319 RepID=A0ABZ0US93_9RICK|nr:hemolysin family protein [Candidatus Trichorickettsia mobilis]WPY00885.1 Hemolysin C [Candidatus Trichorickettsia mobilis]